MHPTALSSGAFTILWLLLAAPVEAQALPAEPDLTPGSRIRVTTVAPKRRLTGTLVGVAGDSLRLAVGSRDTVGVSLPLVTRLEQSGGSRANYAKGALIGGGVGLALGLGLGALADAARNLGCESPTCDRPGNLGGSLAIGGLAGAGVGAGLGALLASAFRKERWQPVVRPGRSVGVGVRLGF
jgi:hypothetical protein